MAKLGRPGFSQEMIDDIKSLWQSGLSKHEVAERLCISEHSVWRYTRGLSRDAPQPPTEDGEVWREIPGYGGKYLVSSHGRIYSRLELGKGPHVMSPSTDSSGYRHVCLSFNGSVTGHTVSSLVALAFCGKKPYTECRVIHLDGNKSNDYACNIAWNTRMEKHKLSPEEYVAEADEYIDGEEWRPVAWNPDRYYVSNMGRIYTNGASGVRPHIMSGRISNSGYVLINLNKDNDRIATTVHRIVAEAFCDGRTEDRSDVNHKNGIKTDNRAENLEWVTKSENMLHSFRVLGRERHSGIPSKTRKLTNEQALAVLHDNRALAEIAQDYGVTPRVISLIKRRKSYREIDMEVA